MKYPDTLKIITKRRMASIYPSPGSRKDGKVSRNRMNRIKATSPVRISSIRGPINIVWGLRHKVVFETTFFAIKSVAGHFLLLEFLNIAAFRKGELPGLLFMVLIF
jgi:hypothetical protein